MKFHLYFYVDCLLRALQYQNNLSFVGPWGFLTFPRTSYLKLSSRLPRHPPVSRIKVLVTPDQLITESRLKSYVFVFQQQWLYSDIGGFQLLESKTQCDMFYLPNWGLPFWVWKLCLTQKGILEIVLVYLIGYTEEWCLLWWDYSGWAKHFEDIIIFVSLSCL